MPSSPSRLLSIALRTLLAIGSAAVNAEDVLLSARRLNKRFVDDQGNYNISFYHINDVHAHLDQFAAAGTDCVKPEKGCFGGYARVRTAINETRPSHKDSLFLNVGDEFQGTLFYSYYGGEKIAETLNQMGFDGMTLGNHEWDGSDEALGQFLENLTFPIISANVHSENEKLKKIIKPYHIYEEYGLAVIGATTETTSSISKPDKSTVFSNVTEAVQNTINHIKSTTNITRIAAITHIGYEEDQKLAESTTGLHLIMGGHSHTPLGDFKGAQGPYPTIKKNRDGDEVFIVTAYRWGEYLGYIDVTYDTSGKILAYHGGPIHLTNETKQDEELQDQINKWREPFDAFSAEEVGETKVPLDAEKCKQEECLLGDVIADAMIAYRRNVTDDVAFAITNGGGVRASIDAGPITRGEVLTSFPFGNAVVDLTYSGADLWKIFEGLFSGVNQFNQQKVTSFPQVSKDVRVAYNPAKEAGSRLVSLEIRGEPVDKAKEYTITTVDFLATGGDSFFVAQEGFATLDALDSVLVDYFKSQGSLDVKVDGRIATTDKESGAGGGGSGGGKSNSTTTTSASDPQKTNAAPVLGQSVIAGVAVALMGIFLNM